MKPAYRFIALFLFLLQSSFAERVEHKGCYAEWSDKELVIGNDLVERKWTIDQGLLKAASIKDKKTGTEWIRQPGRQPAPHPEGDLAKETRTLTFGTYKGKQNPVEKDSLTVNLIAKGANETNGLGYLFQIFPDSSGITIQFYPDTTNETTETEKAAKEEK